MYATKTDMQERYTENDLVQLTDRIEPYTGAIVDSVLDQALEDAGAVVDTYIARRYDLPLGTVPKAVTLYTCVIAFYNLHQGRHTDEIRKSYEDALAFLDKVAAGRIVLDVEGTEPTSAPADARVDSADQLFNRDTLKGF